MVWSALIGAGASLLGGALSSRSAGRTADQQARIAREQSQAQERIAQQQLQFINRMAGEQAAANYPRMRAGNAALQNVTDIMGLGDIYAAPSPDSLGGGQEFYPRAPVTGTYQQPGNAPSAVGNFYNNMVGGSPYESYVRAHPDLLNEYRAFADRPGGYAFGPNLPAIYDEGGDGRIDMGDYGRFHYERFGQGEGRELPEDLLF